jgi:hypothetical protein
MAMAMDLAPAAVLAGDMCEALCSYSYIPLQRFLSLFLFYRIFLSVPYPIIYLLTPPTYYSSPHPLSSHPNCFIFLSLDDIASLSYFVSLPPFACSSLAS